MATFVSAAQVRDYLNITATTGQFSTGQIGSNVNAASAFLERRTNRQFEWQGSNVRKVFSTEGRAYLTIPDLIVANSVTLQGAALVENQSYWLHPDAGHSGVYTGIQIQPFGSRRNYLANPDWFDRGLDMPLGRYYGFGQLPNDLAITGEWGWVPLPDELLHATIVLAAYYTKRPDAILSGGIQTPEGGVFDLSRLPVEVTQFIADWKIDFDASVSI